MKKGRKGDLKYFLSLNYPMTIDRYEDNGKVRFGIQVPDLPGVWADGKTMPEALKNLSENKKLWFETCIENGIEIPEPVSEEDFSGKFILRLPPELHMKLSKQAQKERVSLNQYVRSTLEEDSKYTLILEKINEVNKELKIQKSENAKSKEKDKKEINKLKERIERIEGFSIAVDGLQKQITADSSTNIRK